MSSDRYTRTCTKSLHSPARLNQSHSRTGTCSSQYRSCKLKGQDNLRGWDNGLCSLQLQLSSANHMSYSVHVAPRYSSHPEPLWPIALHFCFLDLLPSHQEVPSTIIYVHPTLKEAAPPVVVILERRRHRSQRPSQWTPSNSRMVAHSYFSSSITDSSATCHEGS